MRIYHKAHFEYPGGGGAPKIVNAARRSEEGILIHEKGSDLPDNRFWIDCGGNYPPRGKKAVEGKIKGMNLSKFKKSDRKKIEQAWSSFHEAMTSLMKSMQFLLDIPDDEVTVEELNTLVACIKKLDKHIKKMGEVRMLRLKKDYEEEWW